MAILNRSLSDIATTIPGASAFLHHLDINFCLHGMVTLQQALELKGLDPEEVVADLAELEMTGHHDEVAINWDKEPRMKLIGHILERYHARHREQLPTLIFLAAKVERVHSESTNCPHGLSELLRDISHELESHMMKEEQILFPMLAGGIYPNGPINVMQDEHLEHLEAINRLCRLTNNMKVPAGACNSWRSLYIGLQTLVDDLMRHITLENYFLFVPPKAIAENTGCCGSCQ
ncbi:MAG: iron-sulfur cluster repair di-iron protein [Saccharospirillaceae bacterium]|nr:iron-sulfur cluster repair di-iron protein [Saccharospirillaceae bacterium]MCD8530839.1 iron-sulfur cluster repair di-iron protein [Saccharospirillaceae bacterium]